jgi:sarcosine oxidase, subunit gamma
MRDLSPVRAVPEVVAGRNVHQLPPAARLVLRGGAEMRRAASDALGLPLPAEACRAELHGERAALWLGPDEWLLIAPVADGEALAALLSAALESLPHSVVAVGHRQTALAVKGPDAETLLASGCALDLNERAFPVGMCTRTMLGKAEVVLWRTGEQAFRIEVWRSFAAYVSQFLAEAARGII